MCQMGNGLTEAFSAEDIAKSRTLERGPSAPTRMEPWTIVPSPKVAMTPSPLSLKAMSTSSFPYCLSVSGTARKKIKIKEKKDRTYLDCNPLAAQCPHFASRHPQTFPIRHACEHVTCLSVNDGVVSACFDRHRGIARGSSHVRINFWWQDVFQPVKRPMDGHGPLIASDVECLLLFEDGVTDAGLSSR